MSETGQKTVTVTFGGKTASFTVSVTEIKLTEISVTTNPIKTSYAKGETLDLTGMVVMGTYDDGTTKTETEYTVFPQNGIKFSATGVQQVTVTKDSFTDRFGVSVGDAVLSSIKVQTVPTNTVYKAGETIDTTGLVVKGIYTDDTAVIITGFSTSAQEAGGTAGITVTYKDLTDKTFTCTTPYTVLCAVSFDTNGYETFETQYVVPGETATAPDTSAHEYIDYQCWYTDSAKFDFSLPVTAHTALKAVPYTALFDYTADGTNVTIKKVKDDYKNIVTDVIFPAKIENQTVKYLLSSCFTDNLKLTNVDFSRTSITSLPDSCLANKPKLVKAVLPSGITSLYETFKNCAKLTSVNVPDSVKKLLFTFYGCSSLENVCIPNSVTEIYFTFENCTSLTTVNVPDSVTNMDYAFSGCTSLTTVNVPDSVNRMRSAFLNCTSLTTVNVPNSVTDLANTFRGCTSLTTVNIPKSVTSLAYTFFNCSNLSVTFESSTPATDGNSNPFYSVKKILVPSAAVDDYKTAWSNCADIIEGY